MEGSPRSLEAIRYSGEAVDLQAFPSIGQIAENPKKRAGQPFPAWLPTRRTRLLASWDLAWTRVWLIFLKRRYVIVFQLSIFFCEKMEQKKLALRNPLCVIL
jgi:hypothetical protein